MKNRIVFIIAVGRSGTKWLANILSKSDNTIVYHEHETTPMENTRIYLNKTFNKNLKIDFTKKKEFIKEQLKGNGKTYIEVNGYLRLCIPELKKAFPEAIFIHLIRNGKDVVRSMVSKKKSLLGKICKKYDTDLFKHACKIWNDDNREIFSNVSKVVKFENLTSHYLYYKEDVANFIGVTQYRGHWVKMKNRRVNSTSKYILPEYTNWDKQLKNIFNRICGNTMRQYGYK